MPTRSRTAKRRSAREYSSRATVEDYEKGEGHKVDNETFKTYTFYIKTGDEAVDVGLTLTLGDIEHDDQYFAGRAYVNRIAVTDIGNVAYENELDKFDEKSEGYAEYIKYNNNVDLSTDEDESEGGEEEGGEEQPASEIAWWLVPSILFAVAILIAVVGTLIRKLLERRSEKKTIKVATSYDRRTTLHKLHNEKSKNEGDKVAAEADTTADYDEFDDTLPASDEKAEEKAEEVEESKPEAEEPEKADKQEDSYDEFDDDKKSDKAPSEEAPTGETKPEETEKSEVNETEAKPEKKEKAKPEKPEKDKAKTPAPAPKKDGYYDDFED